MNLLRHYRAALFFACSLGVLYGVALATVSDGAALGPETEVSVNQNGGELRCEPSVAAFGDTIVVAWNDSYGGQQGSSTGVAIAWAISSDRGKTFSFGGYLPGRSEEPVMSGADPGLAADSHGNFFLTLLSWQKNRQELLLYKLAETQRRWSLLGRFPGSDVTNNVVDRSSLLIDAQDRLFVTLTTQYQGQQQIALLRWTDGDGWTAPVVVSTGAEPKTASHLFVDGQTIAIGWLQLMKHASEVRLTFSRDGGQTFTAPVVYATGTTPSVIDGYVMGFSPQAQSIVFPSSGIGIWNGKDYVVTDLPVASEYNVRIGVTSDPDLQFVFPGIVSNFFPATVTTTDGPAVLAYCRTSKSALTQVCLSVPLGGSRRRSIIVSAVGTDWSIVQGDKTFAPVQRNFGDYISLAYAKTYLVAAWTDGRGGFPRIYTRIVELQPAPGSG